MLPWGRTMSALGLLKAMPHLVGLEEEAREGQLLAGLHRLAAQVEEAWDTLPEEQKQALTAFAYLAVDPPRDWRTRLSLALGRWGMALRMIRGDEEEVAQLILAAHRLIHAVLDAIERENPIYGEELDRRLAELNALQPDQLLEVPGSEPARREWLEGLLRKTDA